LVLVIIKEKQQPYNESIDWIFNYFDNLVIYEPSYYVFLHTNIDYNNVDYRLGVRYQYAFENSDKKVK
jgi:hypothetical protein